MHQIERVGVAVVLVFALTHSAGARAATIEVPIAPLAPGAIQAAVDAAAPGDTIVVRRGTYCGATLDKAVHLVGIGEPTIVGCDGGPALANGLRVGFLLPGGAGESAASGSKISGFVFDGRGVSNQNPKALAFGVLGRFANEVVVARNHFEGTVQAITNTAGDRWTIYGNRVDGLTLFDCTGFCTGGDGIVVQTARAGLAVPGGSENPVNRPEENRIFLNSVAGAIPDGFDAFSMVGILVLAADDTTIAENRLAIADNPNADATGEGIAVGNACCGIPTPLEPGSRNTKVVFNDGRASQFAVVIEGTGGANTDGLVLFRNLGTMLVEGAQQTTALRAAVAPSPRQPTQ